MAKGRQHRTDLFPGDVFERLAAEDRVVPANLLAAQIADVFFEVGDGGVGESPRHPVEGDDLIAHSDEQRRYQSKTGADLEDLRAAGQTQEVELHPLLLDPLFRVIGDPLRLREPVGHSRLRRPAVGGGAGR